jgi:hypothetical protein
MAKKCFILISLFIVKETTAITFLSYPSIQGFDAQYYLHGEKKIYKNRLI